MGTRIVEPEPGGICAHWEPPDETPEFLYVVFWDVLKGTKPGAAQVPNSHIFRLYQKPVTLCIWEHENLAADWLLTLNLQADVCSLRLEDTSGMNHTYFRHTKAVSPPAEYELFTNFFQSEVLTYGYGGYAMVFWMDAIQALVTDFGFDHVDDLMLEIFGIEDTDFVVKLCSLSLNTNVKYKISR